MLDMKEHSGASVGAAMAQKNVIIGRTWPIWPNHARVTIGSAAEMQTFQTAFLEVMQMPADKVSLMIHPYPHLRDAHVC
jgi:histidinol-phosphate aminotransferase